MRDFRKTWVSGLTGNPTNPKSISWPNYLLSHNAETVRTTAVGHQSWLKAISDSTSSWVSQAWVTRWQVSLGIPTSSLSWGLIKAKIKALSSWNTKEGFRLGLEIQLGCYGCLLLLYSTKMQFPEAMLGTSKPCETPAPAYPMPSSGLYWYLHMLTDRQTHIHTHKKIDKKYNLNKNLQ